MWNGWIAAGLAARVYIISLSGVVMNCVELPSYFGSFHITSAALLIACGEGITCLSDAKRNAWQNMTLALDGVVIERVENDPLYGAGDWDPPGGWQPFVFSLRNGKKYSPGHSLDGKKIERGKAPSLVAS